MPPTTGKSVPAEASFSSQSLPALRQPQQPQLFSASSATSVVPAILQHAAPLVPALAMALLALCALRAFFRRCQRQRRQRQQQRQRQLATAVTTPAMANVYAADTEQHLAVAPWELPYGIDSPEGSPPLFLLQQHHPDLFFPNSPFLLFPNHPWAQQHQQPMPPKYEDALKLPPPPVSNTHNTQPLCIASLALRQSQQMLSPVGEQSPPPCYDQVRAGLGGGCFQQQQPQMRLFIQRREHPPNYSISAENLSTSGGGGDDASGNDAGGVASLSALSDRPCSSCSLVEDPRALVERRLRTFVAKSARRAARVAADERRALPPPSGDRTLISGAGDAGGNNTIAGTAMP